MIYKSIFEAEKHPTHPGFPELEEEKFSDKRKEEYKEYQSLKSANDIAKMLIRDMGGYEEKYDGRRTTYEMNFHAFSRSEWSNFIKRIKNMYSLCKITGQSTAQLDMVAAMIEELDQSEYFNR